MIGDALLRRELQTRMAGKILFDEPAACHTSIGVGGPIDVLLFPESEAEIADIVDCLHKKGMPFFPVGNWTNLIVRDAGYRGVLVSLARLRNLILRDEGKGSALLLAEAGCPLSELVSRSADQALKGMEFCAGIPGSVGGAVRMNAGAYGGEIKDVVESVLLLDAPGAVRTAARQDLHFAYRHLDLPVETIIISAAFRLHRGNREEIDGRIREIMQMRCKKHPLEFRNAGSIFKNPRDCPAGRLIEAAGLKGARIGDAQVSEKHANFIVNRGQARADEIERLMALVQIQVQERTGYRLEPEVKIIGE